MTRSEAREVILAHLQSQDEGKATNSDLIDEIGGDEDLYQRVREDLIMGDLAEDYKGAGLKYIGRATDPGVSADNEDLEALAPSAGADRPASPRYIFLSYGRKDAEDLARRLKEILEHDGHTVWIDKSEIKSGRAWEAQIEEALLGADLAVTILSPHAVRRPEGVCLDEISFARYHGADCAGHGDSVHAAAGHLPARLGRPAGMGGAPRAVSTRTA